MTAVSKHLLHAIRSRIDQVSAQNKAFSPPLPTGIHALDHHLKGGIPRGRVTEITAPLGVGKTALLQQVAAGVLAQQSWVAWIDSSLTLAPAPWAQLGKRFVAIRPKARDEAVRAADILLRSGLFTLVVLDNVSIMSRNVTEKLARIARDRDAALVLTTDLDRAAQGSGVLRIKISLKAAVAAPASAPASGGRVLSISLPNLTSSIQVSRATTPPLARSLRAHPPVPDRRGVESSKSRRKQQHATLGHSPTGPL